MSHDGRFGITLIAMIGSAFSPYYALSRRYGLGDPLDHCVLNVALYDGQSKRWAMTERGRDSLRRTPTRLTIGPSALSWDGNMLLCEIDEVTAPFPSRIRGQVRIYPIALVDHPIALDGAGRHLWTPIAPCARVDVTLSDPELNWSGAGYLDGNRGDEPLETAFERWTWSRASLSSGAAVLYDVKRRAGDDLSVAIRFDRSGAVEHFAPPPQAGLPPTRWRMPRTTRADAGYEASVMRTLEDAPFYARSVLSTRLLGERTTAVHESLSLDCAARLSTRLMIPFRNPRALR